MAKTRRARGTKREGPDFKRICGALGISTRNMPSGGHSYGKDVETVHGRVRGRVSKEGREALVNAYHAAETNLVNGGDMIETTGLLAENANAFPADFVRSGLETCITALMKGNTTRTRAVTTLDSWKKILDSNYVRQTIEGYINRGMRSCPTEDSIPKNMVQWNPYLTQEFVDRIAGRHYSACLEASESAMRARGKQTPEQLKALREQSLQHVETALARARELSVGNVDALEKGYMEHCMKHLEYTRMMQAAERVDLNSEEKLGYQMRASLRAIDLTVKKRITEEAAVGYVNNLELPKEIQEMVMHELNLLAARGR